MINGLRRLLTGNVFGGPPPPSLELRAQAVSQIPGSVRKSREIYHVAGSLSSGRWNTVRGGAANELYRWAYRHGYTSSGEVEGHFGWEIENEMERQGLSGPRGYPHAPALPPGTVLTAEIIAPRLPPLVKEAAKAFPKNISARSWNFIRDAIVTELARWAHQRRYVPTESDKLLAQFGHLVEAEMTRQGYSGAAPEKPLAIEVALDYGLNEERLTIEQRRTKLIVTDKWDRIVDNAVLYLKRQGMIRP